MGRSAFLRECIAAICIPEKNEAISLFWSTKVTPVVDKDVQYTDSFLWDLSTLVMVYDFLRFCRNYDIRSTKFRILFTRTLDPMHVERRLRYLFWIPAHVGRRLRQVFWIPAPGTWSIPALCPQPAQHIANLSNSPPSLYVGSPAITHG